MSLINWSTVLGTPCEVIYSALSREENRDEFDDSVALLKLSSGYHIDILWHNETKKYVVTLFKDVYEKFDSQVELDTANEVIEEVCDLAARYAPRLATSSASTSNSPVVELAAAGIC
jgi:hypothetical protein